MLFRSHLAFVRTWYHKMSAGEIGVERGSKTPVRVADGLLSWTCQGIHDLVATVGGDTHTLTKTNTVLTTPDPLN